MSVCILKRRCCVFVFFFKQKTAYELRISDWSSDVCSSDLGALARADLSAEAYHRFVWHVAADLRAAFVTAAGICPAPLDRALTAAAERSLAGQLGRASCRERVCQCV